MLPDIPKSRAPATYSRREALTLASALALGAVVGGCGSPKGAIGSPGSISGKPNIVVYLADTLRADHLGCYGHSVPTSPQIDAFARESTLFERCYSTAPWTKPSIASLFTGVLPRVHQACMSVFPAPRGQDANVQILRDDFETLAEGLKAQGYNTALFTCNTHVQKKFGFAQGFDHYYYKLAQPPAEQMMNVRAWLDEVEEPFFLFVHELDPHGPYTPRLMRYKELFGEFQRKAEGKLDEGDLDLIERMRAHYNDPKNRRPDLRALSPAGTQHARNLYDAEIYELDYQFGKLLRQLKRLKIAERTVVAFTADHGEAFNDHSRYYHGSALINEMIHVPLILRLPRQTQGIRVSHTVSLLDLYATMMTVGGAPIPEYAQSRPLVEPDGALAVHEDWPAFSDLDHGVPDRNDWDSSMTLGDHKVVTFNHGDRVVVFDKTVDPGETVDALTTDTEKREIFEKLTATFKAQQQDQMRLASSFGKDEWTIGGPDYQDELKAMGYLD